MHGQKNINICRNISPSMVATFIILFTAFHYVHFASKLSEMSCKMQELKFSKPI